jgi:hypothetical protein
MMPSVTTIEHGPVVHHVNFKKIAHIRHETRSPRATLFLEGGNEIVVVFNDHNALVEFVNQYRLANM